MGELTSRGSEGHNTTIATLSVSSSLHNILKTKILLKLEVAPDWDLMDLSLTTATLPLIIIVMNKWQFRKEIKTVEDPLTDIWTDLAKNWVLGNSENKFAKTQEKAVGCTGGWGKGDLH